MNETFIRIFDLSFEAVNQSHLTLCIWEIPKGVILQTVKTQMKYSKIAFNQGLYCLMYIKVKKDLQKEEYKFFQKL